MINKIDEKVKNTESESESLLLLNDTLKSKNNILDSYISITDQSNK